MPLPRDIHLDTDIAPVSEFRSNTAAFIDKVRASGRPMVLTQRGRSSAVLLDVRAYQDMLDELDTLRDIHQGLADERAGRVTGHDEARDRLLMRYRT